jgi:hypothetical protein
MLRIKIFHQSEMLKFDIMYGKYIFLINILVNKSRAIINFHEKTKSKIVRSLFY